MEELMNGNNGRVEVAYRTVLSATIMITINCCNNKAEEESRGGIGKNRSVERIVDFVKFE